MEEGAAQEPNATEVETALTEIKFADPELYEFLKWVSHHDGYDEQEFTEILGAVYSYARAKNDPNVDEIEEEVAD